MLYALKILLLFVCVFPEFGGYCLYLLAQIVFLLPLLHLLAHAVGYALFHAGKVHFRKHVHAQLFHAPVHVRFLQNLLTAGKPSHYLVCQHVGESKVVGVDGFGNVLRRQFAHRLVDFGVVGSHFAGFFEQSLALAVVFAIEIQRLNVGKQNIRRRSKLYHFRRFQRAHGNYRRFGVVFLLRYYLRHNAHFVKIASFRRHRLRQIHLTDHKEQPAVFQREPDGVARKRTRNLYFRLHVGEEEISSHGKQR